MSIKYKVLVAEDELKIREILVDCLMDDYEVIEAKDGLEALRLFHSQQFDLVLLDVMMPEKDGFSVLKEIRLVSKVPVIMLTARSSVEDQVRGYDLKVDDYVTKPFGIRELVARVKANLRRLEVLEKQAGTSNGNQQEYDRIVINLDRYEVQKDGKVVDLRYINKEEMKKHLEIKNQDILFAYSINVLKNSFLLK